MEYTNLINTLNQIGLEVRNKYKDKISSATGKLYNSIDYKVTISSDSIKLLFIAEDYWINVEEGRKAGSKMPPIRDIEDWIISKGLPEKKGLAYIIARSIAEKGIKPTYYLRDIMINNDFSDEIAKALQKDINIEINKWKY